MTKYLSRAMIVVLPVFLKMPLRADSIPEIVAKAKPAIVEIVVKDATGAPKMLGTLPTVTPTPPADAVAHFDSGMAFLERQEYDKAINDFTEAIRLDPNVAIIYFNRGNAYYDRGNLDKASNDYNEAIRLNPNFARA
jgi:tetratricopeptide (TPR) repeat protein